ncbi:MAG TPA: succinate--CoA ligase subunit beta, partial [Archaeoglobus sp.]|nr:succinate--CoA ligase subunit beta [Archaeoglobus sp.]
IILMDENVKAVFINIFGGITRCDEVAKGLINAFNDINISVPIVIRLAGTNEEEGKDILKDYIEGSNLDIHIVETMEEGAKKIVELSR